MPVGAALQSVHIRQPIAELAAEAGRLVIKPQLAPAFAGRLEIAFLHSLVCAVCRSSLNS
jgi:hypothetical protein